MITKIQGGSIENNYMILLLTNVDIKLNNLDIESCVLIKGGLSGEYEEIDFVKTMVL